MTPLSFRPPLRAAALLAVLAIVACEGSTTEPPDRAGFDIILRYHEPLSATQTAAFAAAAARWRSVITGDVPDMSITAATGVTADRCGIRHDAFTGTIDDLLIFVDVDSIDGPGGQVGGGGPCFFRNASRITVIGVMKFDEADMPGMQANGTLETVILHEMGHVFGFSPDAWSELGLVDGPDTADPTFNGANARSRFVLAGGMSASGVPIENSGGVGTIGAHWRESVFGTELMTGFIATGASPLSAITLGSLDDMGYQVSYAAADAYTVPSATAMRLEVPKMQIIEQIFRPIGGIDP